MVTTEKNMRVAPSIVRTLITVDCGKGRANENSAPGWRARLESAEVNSVAVDLALKRLH